MEKTKRKNKSLSDHKARKVTNEEDWIKTPLLDAMIEEEFNLKNENGEVMQMIILSKEIFLNINFFKEK